MIASASPAAPARELSVIMPLYNCVALTQACVESLLATLPSSLNWELILVDDGSTDGTRDWLATVSNDRIRILLNPANQGYARSNNAGAAAAGSALLLLLNNDLILTPGWLEPMLSALRIHPGSLIGNVQYSARTGALDHAGIAVTAKGKPEHIRELAPLSPSLLSAFAVTGACLLLERSTWDAVGGFDTSYVNGGEDVDFCLRAAAQGHRCWVATQSRIFHHVSSSPNRKLRDEANSARLARRWQKELVLAGVDAYVDEFLRRELTAGLHGLDPAEALHFLLHWLGITQLPPPAAIRGVAANFQFERDRWASLGL